MLPECFVPIAEDKIYRLFNIGATGLIAAEFEGDVDVMPASWVCALDLVPCKVTAVIDKTHYTRALVEKSGYFAIGLPGAGIVKETLYLGSVSKNDEADKMAQSGVTLLEVPNSTIPMVEGCVAWAVFKVVSEPHNEKSYDVWSIDNIREVCNKHLEQFGIRNISGVRIETMTSNFRFSNFVIAVYREKCYSNYKGE